jgi:glycosyltransferase involved in cell wall biosynthesis
VKGGGLHGIDRAGAVVRDGRSLACPAGTRGHAESPSASLRLVHVTTVPQTLMFLAGQAGYLRRRGIEVFAISSPGAALERFREAEGIECFPVSMERRITPARDLVALARLWVLLRRIRPHIVDAHTPKGGLLGMTAACLAGVPGRIYHLHGMPFMTASGLRRHLLRATERIASSLATRVLCVSRSIAEVAAAAGLARDGKIGVLLGGSINGVDAAGRFRPPADPNECRAWRAALGIPPDSRVIGFVGRLVREKGLAELARAWLALRREMPDLRLLLVGPHEPHDPIPEDVAAMLRTDPRVLVVGFDWDTPKYYRAMDVLALPSYREGFPVVPLEAAAMRLPVVATSVPGCVDAVVDGVTGTLVAPRDDRALAVALRAYLDDASLRQCHGAAARERVLRDFEQERIWSALHAEYVHLASGAERNRWDSSMTGPGAPWI